MNTANSKIQNKTDRIINGIDYNESLTRTYQLEFDSTYLVTCFPVANDIINHNIITIAIIQTGRVNGKNGQIIILFQTNDSGEEDKDYPFLSLGTNGILTINHLYKYMHYSITKL